MKSMAGLSLIEVLIVAGVSVLVGILLVVIIVNSAGLYSKESTKVEESLNINEALQKVRQTIKESSGVASSYTADSTTYTSSDTQLVLKVASLDSGGSLIGDTYDYYVFFKDQSKLRFKIFPNIASFRQAQDQIFSTSLESLNFQYLNSATPPVEVAPETATKVKITLSLKKKSGASFETNIATSEAGLRND